MQGTIIFQKTWEAINTRLPDGSRKYKYIIHEGSSRSSKTHSLFQCYYLYGWNNPNKRLSVWRDTKKDCVETVGFDMLRAYRGFDNYNHINYHETKSIFRFPNNTVIEIQGTDDEEKIMGYNGNVTWLNEPYKISKDTFDQLDQRTTDFCFIDWNPKKSHWIEDLKKDPRTLVIHSTFKDNPFCPPEQRKKILSYQPLKLCELVSGKALELEEAKTYNILKNEKGFAPHLLSELQLCRENEFKNSASEFKWSVYGLGIKAERPNRIFKFIEISDDEFNKLDAPLYYATDWGMVDKWGILGAKYYDGALYLKELNYDSENEIKEKLTIAERNQIAGHDEGLVMWMFRKLGIDNESYIICDNNRPKKILSLREAGFEYALAAVKGPDSILEGIDLLDKLKVYYTSTSTNLKYEQENYSRKVDRYGIVLEEPEDLNNHLIDPARYLATFLQKEGIINII